MVAKKVLNTAMSQARVAKKDEFYTQLTDIEKELKHYRAKFRGKVVYCNCDDPNESNFVKFFKLNFEHLSLKKLVATHYQSGNLLTLLPPYKLEYRGNGKKGGEPDESKVKIQTLKGDGDFRGEEAMSLLNEADIVVTNPPFSLFREYVSQLIEHGKQFLILGQQGAITYKECFEFIRDGQMWLGHDNGGTKWFQVPDDYDIKTESRKKVVNGVKYFSMGSVYWYTNIDHAKRHETLTLYKKYTPDEYPKFDNYDAINVNRVAEIPMDYEGVMGVPITFLDKHNPEQFEIVGNEYTLGIAKGRGYVNGKRMFGRVFIRRKK